MSGFHIENLSVLRGTTKVVDDVSLELGAGELVGLIGPNGAGKTTLMRAALGLLPHSGQSSLNRLSPQERAKTAAWMPQAREIAWPVSVETLVMLGRVPHLGAGQRPSETDHAAVGAAIKAMDLQGFETRSATELSGGEQARVLIARVLAQDTSVLFADEPVAGLDPGHQIATMETFAKSAISGKSVLVSLHDLGLAARHCHRLVLMDKGRILADGAPKAVLTAENLHKVFGITAYLSETKDGLVFLPLEVAK